MAPDHREFDGTLQFTHVSGPVVGHEVPETIRMNFGHGFSGRRADLAEKGHGEQGNVVSPVFQRRKMNTRDADPVQ